MLSVTLEHIFSRVRITRPLILMHKHNCCHLPFLFASSQLDLNYVPRLDGFLNQESIHCSQNVYFKSSEQKYSFMNSIKKHAYLLGLSTCMYSSHDMPLVCFTALDVNFMKKPFQHHSNQHQVGVRGQGR